MTDDRSLRAARFGRYALLLTGVEHQLRHRPLWWLLEIDAVHAADVVLEPDIEGMSRLGEIPHEGVSTGTVMYGDDPATAIRHRSEESPVLGEAVALIEVPKIGRPRSRQFGHVRLPLVKFAGKNRYQYCSHEYVLSSPPALNLTRPMPARQSGVHMCSRYVRVFAR